MHDAGQNDMVLANGLRLIAPKYGEAYNDLRKASEGASQEQWLKLGKEYLRLTSVYDIYFANDVEGIHLYTMNNPMIARRICDSIAGLRSL